MNNIVIRVRDLFGGDVIVETEGEREGKESLASTIADQLLLYGRALAAIHSLPEGRKDAWDEWRAQVEPALERARNRVAKVREGF